MISQHRKIAAQAQHIGEIAWQAARLFWRRCCRIALKPPCSRTAIAASREDFGRRAVFLLALHLATKLCARAIWRHWFCGFVRTQLLRDGKPAR